MSRREPMNQIKWEDFELHANSYFAEKVFVAAGPFGLCRITVFRRKSESKYVMICNLDTSLQRSLSATTMHEAKSEAVDIVRILLHNILSDL